MPTISTNRHASTGEARGFATGSPHRMRRIDRVRRALPIIVTLVATLAMAACAGDGDQPEPSDPFAVSPTEATPTSPAAEPPVPPGSPTPPAIPHGSPATKGPANATCEQGWVTPPAGTPMFTDPLGLILIDRTGASVTSRWSTCVCSLDRIASLGRGGCQGLPAGHPPLVHQTLRAGRLSYQGRFIVERAGSVAGSPRSRRTTPRVHLAGLERVPVRLGERRRKPYPGLPGAWSGIRYDFVRGGAGLSIPGLPDEVIGCLDGTSEPATFGSGLPADAPLGIRVIPFPYGRRSPPSTRSLRIPSG